MGIYIEAFKQLSEDEQRALLDYNKAMLELQHAGTNDPTRAIEQLIKDIPGSKKAIRRYDKFVGSLMQKPVSTPHN